MAASLVLIDASAILYQAFFSTPHVVRCGQPVNLVLGFCNLLWKLVRRLEHPDHVVIAWDASRCSFRHGLYPGYKAGRTAQPALMVQQMPLVRKAIGVFGIHLEECPDYESDDIIATYAHQAEQAGAFTAIVNPDKDVFQLVTEKTKIFSSKKLMWIDAEHIKKTTGVWPDQFVDFQALMGDPTDKIPGVDGIGELGARQLIQRYGSLEGVLLHAYDIPDKAISKRVRDGFDDALLSKSLATLRKDVPLAVPFLALPKYVGDYRLLVAFLKGLGFVSLPVKICQDCGLVERLIEPMEEA